MRKFCLKGALGMHIVLRRCCTGTLFVSYRHNFLVIIYLTLLLLILMRLQLPLNEIKIVRSSLSKAEIDVLEVLW